MHKQKLNYAIEKICNMAQPAVCLGMIKVNDIVLTPNNVVGIVQGFHQDGVVKYALLRVYRSQTRLAVAVDSLRPHSFLNN